MISPLRRLDIWYRARRRHREFVSRISQADVVVVSHTKSGRTWLLVMISHLFHLKYGTPVTEIIKFDNLHRLDSRIPKLYYTRYADLTAPDRSARRSGVARSARFVFLFRDPRDVAVSYYFHLQKRSTPVERARKSIPDAVLANSLFDFVVDDQFGLPRIVQLMNRWLEHYAALDHALLVRYEDLRAGPAAELGRIMEFIGAPCRPEDLEKAIEFASLENLREKESGRFFDTERLRPTDSADPDSFKVRRGKVGGYRDYFNAAQLAVIDSMVDERLASSLGYGVEPAPASHRLAQRQP